MKIKLLKKIAVTAALSIMTLASVGAQAWAATELLSKNSVSEEIDFNTTLRNGQYGKEYYFEADAEDEITINIHTSPKERSNFHIKVNNQFGYVNTEKVKSNDNTLISWQFKASGAKRYTLQVIYESDNPISSYNIIMTKKRNGMVVDEREEIVDPVDPIESDNNQPWGPYQPNKPVVEVNYNQAAILEELEDKGWRAVACNPAMTSRIVFSPNQIICLQPQLEVGQTYYYDFNTNKIVRTQPQYINWPNNNRWQNNNGWDNNNRWQNNNSWPNNNGW